MHARQIRLVALCFSSRATKNIGWSDPDWISKVTDVGHSDVSFMFFYFHWYWKGRLVYKGQEQEIDYEAVISHFCFTMLLKSKFTKP